MKQRIATSHQKKIHAKLQTGRFRPCKQLKTGRLTDRQAQSAADDIRAYDFQLVTI
jgi:hypothetical protein